MSKADMIDSNDRDAIKARAAEIAAEDEAAALAERTALYAPLVALVESDAFAHVRDEIGALKQRLSDKPDLYMTISAFAGLFGTFAMQVDTIRSQIASGDAARATS